MRTQPQAITTRAISPNSGHLPGPTSREQFEADVLLIYFYWARLTALLSSPELGAAWLKRPPVDSSDLFDPDLGPEEYEMTFADIAEIGFAKYSGWLYDYAVHAIDHASAERMGDETPYTWFSAHVFDLSSATLPEQYTNDSGDSVRAAADRWLVIAQLANARNILEDGESFFHFSRMHGAEDAGGLGDLSVKQLALLAGIDEVAVRAAAGTRQSDPLPIIERGGHSFIPITAAKKWLEKKGRFQPVRVTTNRSEIDLATAEIRSSSDLAVLLDRRIEEIRKYDIDHSVWKRLETAGVVRGYGVPLDTLRTLDQGFLASVATELEVDAETLLHRAREAIAKDTLIQVASELHRRSSRCAGESLKPALPN